VNDQPIKSFCLQLEIAAKRCEDSGDKLCAEHLRRASDLLNTQATTIDDLTTRLDSIKVIVLPVGAS